MANVEGKATAITVVTPVRHGGRFWLALVFWAGRTMTASLKKLQLLSFIHYARWAVIRRFPDGGEGERLHHTYLFFESNFNGTWDQYIDAFAKVMPRHIMGFWGSSINFPGPRRTGPLLAWVHRHHFEVQYFDTAVDTATATMVVSALELEEKLRAFARDSEGLDAEAFQEGYQELLREVEKHL